MPGVHAVLTAEDLPPPRPRRRGRRPAPGAVPSAAAAGGVPTAGRRPQAGRREPARRRRSRAAAPTRRPTGPGAAGAPGTPPTAAAVPPAQQAPADAAAIPGGVRAGQGSDVRGRADSRRRRRQRGAGRGRHRSRSASPSSRSTSPIDPLDSLRPGGPNARTEGNVFVGGEVKTIKWTAEQHAARGSAASSPTDAEAGVDHGVGRRRQGLRRSRRRRRAHVVSAVDLAPAARVAHGDGLLAERQAVSARLDAERVAHGRVGRRLGRRPAHATSSSSASTPAAGSAARFRARRRWRFRRCCRRS